MKTPEEIAITCMNKLPHPHRADSQVRAVFANAIQAERDRHKDWVCCEHDNYACHECLDELRTALAEAVEALNIIELGLFSAKTHQEEWMKMRDIAKEARTKLKPMLEDKR